MKEKCTAQEEVKRAKRRLKVKEAALKSEMSKQRNGMDLVFIFYSLMSVILLIATTQIIAYHIGTYQENSIFYEKCGAFFSFLGFDITNHEFAYQFFGIPLNVLLDFAVMYTLGYGGFEGSTAFIKSLSLDSGQFVQMPEKKLRRFFRFIFVWYITALLFSIYQMTILSTDTQLSFFLDKVFTGLGISSLVYMYGRKAPKAVADVSIKKPTPPPTPPTTPAPTTETPGVAPTQVIPPAPVQVTPSQFIIVPPSDSIAELFPGGN